ncbi:cutinase [Mycolicibacterium parafortuitum]|uniref:Cutinase n=1 Tax=Mycolicibacterium parafortuitum TaxID=39692 RepID=A0A7I7TZW1_MYCPF|nr:cutinase family protein [Mycolicibacterium parafortuitum]PQD97961.1 cutinase family protein [Mycobacterium sp. EPG1]BBY74702.1 cutinase [Mycolicibacterium parafortuitum]
MKLKRIAGLAGAAVVGATTAVTAAGAVPTAAAQQPCPDVEVVFARGTSEAPGVGGVGQAFVDAVRAQAAPRTVDAYAVNYPAGSNFAEREAFAATVIDGVRDAGNRVLTMSRDCPDTRIVLGGFSQGAVVSGFATSDTVPSSVPAAIAPTPLPDDVADHVAAVVLFGTPSDAFLAGLGAPAITIGPRYADKTLKLCAQGDSICDGAPGGGPNIAHAFYPVNGMVNEGASYAVARL